MEAGYCAKDVSKACFDFFEGFVVESLLFGFVDSDRGVHFGDFLKGS